MFIRSSNGGEIVELLQFNEKHRSWFLDETVCSNGKIYLTSKVDPLFIFVQHLEEHCKTRAQPLEQLLEGSAEMFAQVLKLPQMKMVANQKGPDDLKAFLYDEEKTMKWLKIKFNLIKKSLKQKSFVESMNVATSMNYVKSSVEEEDIDDNSLDSVALGIISEYISLDLIEKLDKVFKISEKSKEPLMIKRKSEAGGIGGDHKRIKVEEQENYHEMSSINVKKESKVTAKTKAMEKAAKGSKSISSFFTKK